MQETFGIASFRSRQQVMKFEAALRRAGVRVQIITTPRDVAVGCGHGAQWWKEFFSTVRMAGYDGDVSLEMEDLTMPMLEGHLTSLRVLKEALVL